MVEQVARTGALLALLLAASACSDDPVGTSSSTSSGATGTGGGGGEGGAGGAGGGTATTTTGSTGGAGGEGGMGGTGGEGGGEAPGAVGVAGQPCATPGDKACAGHAQATKLICGEDHLWTAAGDCPASERCTSAYGPKQGSCQAVLPLCVGKGSSEPLNTDRPEAPENRRVTIVTKRP